jgi:hypothetical protein
MTINALSMIAVDVLGNYVLDHGATLLKEAGRAAVQVASQLYELIMTRLQADPADARNAERFEENPEGYQVPMGDAIAEKLESDSNFLGQLSLLIEEYRKAANTFTESNIDVNSGAVATQGSVAAGAGGVAVAGDVKGKITISNTQSKFSSGGD